MVAGTAGRANAEPAYLAPKLVFVHVMKTAGTSLYRWLQRHYRHDDILTEASNWLGYWRMPPEIRARKRFVRGHFGSYITRYHNAANGFRAITVLRDPVDRTISHYFHGKSAPDAGLLGKIIKTEKLTLDDFLEHPGCAPFASNFQVRNFAYDLNRDYGTEKLAPARFFKAPMGQAEFVHAQEFLRASDLVGFTEDLPAFVASLSDMMGFFPDDDLGGSRGYREGGQTIGPDTERKIRKANALDIELYAWARQSAATAKAAAIISAPRRQPRNPIDLSACDAVRWDVKEPFFGTGWSDVQSPDGTDAPPHRWTIDSEDATLHIKVDPGAQYQLRLGIFRFVTAEQRNHFELFANGAKLELQESASFGRANEGGGLFLARLGPTQDERCELTVRVGLLKTFHMYNPIDSDETPRGLALCSITFAKIDDAALTTGRT